MYVNKEVKDIKSYASNTLTFTKYVLTYEQLALVGGLSTSPSPPANFGSSFDLGFGPSLSVDSF